MQQQQNETPMSGYALQYERLLLQETALQTARNQCCQHPNQPPPSASSPNDESSSNIVQLQKLKLQGILHRSSLNSMLLSAQCRAAKIRSRPLSTTGFERGLEDEGAAEALSALWTIKSRQLEVEDTVPSVIGVGCLSWRERHSSELRGGQCDDGDLVALEASADSFFASYPECVRNDSENDEDNSSDGESSNDEECEPTAKRGQRKEGCKEEPFVVSCASNSPSPDRPASDGQISLKLNTSNNANMPVQNNVQNQYNQQQQERQQPPMNNSHPVLRNDNPNGSYSSHPPTSGQQWNGQNVNNNVSNPHNRNAQPHNNYEPQYQQHQQYNYQNSMQQHNNPYNQQQQPQTRGPQQHQNNNQWQPQSNNNEYNQKRPQTGHFEYNEPPTEAATKKNNPFRTAKELGSNFNNNKPEGGNKNEDDWDEYGKNGGGYNGKNKLLNGNTSSRGGWNKRKEMEDEEDVGYDGNNNHQRHLGANNRSSGTSRPQQLMQSAIRGGPKDKLSEGLKRPFRPPKMGAASSSSGEGNNRSKPNTSNNNSGNNADEELPEELRGLDKDLIEKIENEIVDSGERVTFDDIAGLQNAKSTVFEMVVWPMQRPEMFTGLRATPKGLLLFGPPGELCSTLTSL